MIGVPATEGTNAHYSAMQVDENARLIRCCHFVSCISPQNKKTLKQNLDFQFKLPHADKRKTDGTDHHAPTRWASRRAATSALWEARQSMRRCNPSLN